MPGTEIKQRKIFGIGFDKYVHELTQLKIKNLLEIREKLQKAIDAWHKNNKSEINLIKKNILQFLKKIGYLKEPGSKILR